MEREKIIESLKKRIDEECKEAIKEMDGYILEQVKVEPLNYNLLGKLFVAREFYNIMKQNFVDSNLCYEALTKNGTPKITSKTMELLYLKEGSIILDLMKEFKITNLYYDPAAWKYLILKD
jgi:hypothetical protein